MLSAGNMFKQGPGMGFNVGDLMLIPAYGSGANKSVFRPFKRPIAGSPSECMVCLIGETKEHPVHWR